MYHSILWKWAARLHFSRRSKNVFRQIGLSYHCYQMSTGRVGGVFSLSLSFLRVRGLRQTGIVLRLSFTGLGKVRRDTLHCILIFHSERFRETHTGIHAPSQHSLSVHPVQASPSLFCTLPAFSARPPAGREEARLDDQLPQRRIEIITEMSGDLHSRVAQPRPEITKQPGEGVSSTL